MESCSIIQYSLLWWHCWKKTKEIKDKERKNQTDINKEQTNIEGNVVNQEKVDNIEERNPIDTLKLETQPIHKDKQKQLEEHTNNEENVVNQEIGSHTEDQKLQSIGTSKYETRPIHDKKQTDTNNEQTGGKSEVQVQSTEKEAASENKKPEVQQSNSIEKEEPKTD